MDGPYRARGLTGVSRMKRSIPLIWALMAAVPGLSACAGGGGKGANKEAPEPLKPAAIKASEAKAMVDASDAYIPLDVRTAKEHRQMRIDGAAPLPNDELDARAVEL